MRMRHCRVNPNNTSVADFDNYPWDRPTSLLVNMTMTNRSRISSQLNMTMTMTNRRRILSQLKMNDNDKQEENIITIELGTSGDMMVVWGEYYQL